MRAAFVPIRGIKCVGKLQFRDRAGRKLAMQYRKCRLLAAAGEIQRQFLQGRIVPHYHDVARIRGQFAQALQDRSRTEGVQAMQHVHV